MAFEGLSDRLQATMQRMRGKGKVTEADIKAMMREVRLALLEADVNFKVVKEFVKTVSERALGSDVMQSLTPGQQVIKIVQDELTQLMGGENATIKMANKPPTVVMMVGLQGAGQRPAGGCVGRGGSRIRNQLSGERSEADNGALEEQQRFVIT